jgi:hypothetical protein
MSKQPKLRLSREISDMLSVGEMSGRQFSVTMQRFAEGIDRILDDMDKRLKELEERVLGQ